MLLEFAKIQHNLSKNSQGINLDRSQTEQANVKGCNHPQPRIGTGRVSGSNAVEVVHHKIFLEYVDDRHTDP